MVWSYSENLLRCANDAIQKPEDFGYWGSDDMFVTWGFCGIDKNRDSSILDEMNFDLMSRELMAEFPDDFRIETYNHWAVGHVDRLCVRVLKEDKQITEDNITEAFIKAMYCKDELLDYPVWDDEEYSERSYDAAINVLEDLHFSIRSMVDTNIESWSSQVYRYLSDELGTYVDVDADVYPDDDEILTAVYHLELWNLEAIEEWDEWTNQKELTNIKTIIANKNQLSLFD